MDAKDNAEQQQHVLCKTDIGKVATSQSRKMLRTLFSRNFFFATP